MDFKELLKAQGLDDKQIDAVVKAMSKEKIYTTTEENIEERYNKLKTQKEELENNYKSANDTIADLKKSNKDVEDLQSKIKEYEETSKTQKTQYEEKIKNMAFDSAINNLLSSNKAKHSDLLTSKFDRSKLTVGEDGKVSGLDEQFKTIKESYKDLFEVSLGGKTPTNPEVKPPTEADPFLQGFDM